jgi:hypothetical protein
VYLFSVALIHCLGLQRIDAPRVPEVRPLKKHLLPGCF